MKKLEYGIGILAVVAIFFTVPFPWTMVLWLLEGIVIVSAGLLLKQVKLEKVGWIIFGIGLTTFYIGDWLKNLKYVDKTFVYRYSIIILGSILLLLICVVVNKRSELPGSSANWKYVKWLRRVNVIGLWFYLLQTIGDIYFVKAPRYLYFEFYRVIVMLLIHVGVSLFILNSHIKYDRIISIFGSMCLIFGIAMCFWVNFTFVMTLGSVKVDNTLWYALVAIVLVNIIMVYSTWKLYVSGKFLWRSFSSKD